MSEAATTSIITVASSGPVTLEHRYTHSSSTPIHYVRLSTPSDGPQATVMLLHGFPQSWRAWRLVADLLVDRYTILLPDLRGFGDSGRPLTGYGTTAVGPDLQAVLDDAGTKRVTLVGHDIGAVVAYFFAAANPDVVDKLAFIEAALPTSDRSSWPALWHWPFLMRKDLAEAIVTGNEEAFVRALIYDYAGRTASLEEGMAHYVRQLQVPGGLRSALAWFREGLDNDTASLQAQLPARLQMPVLALGGGLWGDQPLHMLQEVADDVTGGTISDVGHWIPEEDPEALADWLHTFIRGATR